jgi:outer membrane protein assembly factor BamB
LSFFGPVTRRRLLIGGALVVLALGAAIGVYAYNENQPVEKRGSATEEFVTTEEEQPKKPAPAIRVPWPTYGFNRARDHVSPYDHRPPYRRLWQVDGRDTLEFPPSVGYGRLYLAQQKGLFFAINSKTGKVAWRKNFKRCAASSPTLSKGVVYQSYMDFVNCPQSRPGATGFLIAMDADTGRQRWRFKSAPIESSPLLVKRTLYVGSWDRKVYAINARTGRKRWSFQGDDEINTSAAYWKGTIYIGSDGGTLYALNARTGKLRWSAQSNSSFGSREFWYATPTVAYGRVYIGNTDGTMYVYGAKSGKLLWARPLGSYIYSAAAVWKRRVYVGTYDGKFYALDAATGDTVWQREAPAAVHAAPTVMRGVVYYATCSSCGQAAARAVKHGPDGTHALNARNGREIWSFRDGKFANPVVADEKRIYLTGRAFVFGMKPRKQSRRQAR